MFDKYFHILCKLTQRRISFQRSIKNTRDHLIIKPSASSFPSGLRWWCWGGGLCLGAGVGGGGVMLILVSLREKCDSKNMFVIHAAAKLVEGSPRMWKARQWSQTATNQVVKKSSNGSNTLLLNRCEYQESTGRSYIRMVRITKTPCHECQNWSKFAALHQKWLRQNVIDMHRRSLYKNDYCITAITAFHHYIQLEMPWPDNQMFKENWN